MNALKKPLLLLYDYNTERKSRVTPVKLKVFH